MQLSEKETVQMEIQSLLEQFYTTKNQNGNNGLRLFILSSTSVGNGVSGVNNVFCHFLVWS